MTTAPLSLERLLPHDLEAERAVLGAILLDADAFHAAAAAISPDEFYLQSHRRTFAAMAELADAGGIDLVLLADALTTAGHLEAVGGIAYLADLTQGLPRATNVAHYARIVKDRAALRRVIQIGHEAMERAYQADEPAATIIGSLEEGLMKLGATTALTGFRPSWELIPEAANRAQAREERKAEMAGLPTGLRDLDAIITGGLRPGNLVIIGARPGQGKTALCLNIATHTALRSGQRVGIFSLEMSEAEVTDRMIYAEAEIDSYRAQNGYLNREDWGRFNRTAAELHDAFWYVDMSGTLNIHELRAKARRLQVERGLDLLVVDYLQLMAGSGRRGYENRVQEITEVSRGLKQLAKELQCPILAAAQLNRAIETRTGARKPMLSDLRDSGSIEADADMVIFIHREEYYNRTDDNEGKAEFIIGKQRNGATGTVTVAFVKQYAKFTDLYGASEQELPFGR